MSFRDSVPFGVSVSVRVMNGIFSVGVKGSVRVDFSVRDGDATGDCDAVGVFVFSCVSVALE